MFCNILIKFKDNKFKDKMIKYEFTKRGGQKNERYKSSNSSTYPYSKR
mgnify:CR=1 FL=1